MLCVHLVFFCVPFRTRFSPANHQRLFFSFFFASYPASVSVPLALGRLVILLLEFWFCSSPLASAFLLSSAVLLVASLVSAFHMIWRSFGDVSIAAFITSSNFEAAILAFRACTCVPTLY